MIRRMKDAPFLLQALTSRLLGTKSQVTVSRAKLIEQGYDVETLCEMIAAYGELPESERGFVIRATAADIFMQRKPPQSTPPMAAPVASAEEPKAANSGPKKLVVKPVTALKLSQHRRII
jgi:hypothetical protein